MIQKVMLDTHTVAEPLIDWTNMDMTFKLDPALKFDCD